MDVPTKNLCANLDYQARTFSDSRGWMKNKSLLSKLWAISRYEKTDSPDSNAVHISFQGVTIFAPFFLLPLHFLLPFLLGSETVNDNPCFLSLIFLFTISKGA